MKYGVSKGRYAAVSFFLADDMHGSLTLNKAVSSNDALVQYCTVA